MQSEKEGDVLYKWENDGEQPEEKKASIIITPRDETASTAMRRLIDAKIRGASIAISKGGIMYSSPSHAWIESCLEDIISLSKEIKLKNIDSILVDSDLNIQNDFRLVSTSGTLLKLGKNASIVTQGETEVEFEKIYMDHGDFWNNIFQIKNKSFIYKNGSISRGEDTSLTIDVDTGSAAKFIDTNIYYGTSHSMNNKIFIVSSQGSDLEFLRCVFISKRIRIGCKEGSLHSYFGGKVTINDCNFLEEILCMHGNFFNFIQNQDKVHISNTHFDMGMVLTFSNKVKATIENCCFSNVCVTLDQNKYPLIKIKDKAVITINGTHFYNKVQYKNKRYDYIECKDYSRLYLNNSTLEAIDCKRQCEYYALLNMTENSSCIVDGCKFKNIKVIDNDHDRFYMFIPLTAPELICQVEGYYADSIASRADATTIVNNSSFTKEEDGVRHIRTSRRIVCFNCTFDGRDYRINDDIVYKM